MARRPKPDPTVTRVTVEGVGVASGASAASVQGQVAPAPQKRDSVAPNGTQGVNGSPVADFTSWSGVARKPAKRTIDQVTFDRLCAETREAMKTGDWSECTARHVLAYWAIAHELVYGVIPSSTGPERAEAVMRLGAEVKRQFGGDVGRAANFLRWLWTRERGREAWYRREGRSVRPIGWRWMMSSQNVTEYRVDAARAERRGA